MTTATELLWGTEELFQKQDHVLRGEATKVINGTQHFCLSAGLGRVTEMLGTYQGSAAHRRAELCLATAIKQRVSLPTERQLTLGGAADTNAVAIVAFNDIYAQSIDDLLDVIGKAITLADELVE